MLKQTPHTVFVLILLLMLSQSSCTVEKRKYNKGFHITWNKKAIKTGHESLAKQKKDPILLVKPKAMQVEEFQEDSSIVISKADTASRIVLEQTSESNTTSKEIVFPKRWRKVTDDAQCKKARKQRKKENTKDSTANTLARLSSFFGLILFGRFVFQLAKRRTKEGEERQKNLFSIIGRSLGWAALVVGIILALFNAIDAVVILGVPAIISLVGMYFALYSLHQMQSQPDRYTKEGATKAFVAFSVILGLLAFLFTLAIILYWGSWATAGEVALFIALALLMIGGLVFKLVLNSSKGD
ncbi:hypothetical protein [Parvicella tangerina]|uniref:Uncharacterized protein n=1 Tax=Parvicella tangerina TaxID=2829795 RepID=A0A916JQW0_9FLAO|nr:hypothetical protein [Parvicella tangerina]CAG5087567.1 hypothetical protein CRYO30217_03515 [Parvicella tangerina]